MRSVNPRRKVKRLALAAALVAAAVGLIFAAMGTAQADVIWGADVVWGMIGK
jgi:hypothetical protein